MLDVAKERWLGFLTPVVALTYLLDPVNIVKFGRDSSIIELAEQFIHDSYEEQIAINVIRSLWSYLNHVDGFTEAAFLIADRDLPAHVWWAECCYGHKRSALQSLAIRLLHIGDVGDLRKKLV